MQGKRKTGRIWHLSIILFSANLKRNLFLTVTVGVSILLFLCVAWYLDFSYATSVKGNSRVQENYIAVNASTKEAYHRIRSLLDKEPAPGNAAAGTEKAGNTGTALSGLTCQRAVPGGTFRGSDDKLINVNYQVFQTEKFPEGIGIYSGLDGIGNTEDPSNDKNYEQFRLIAGQGTFRAPNEVILSAAYVYALGKKPQEMIGEKIVMTFEDTSYICRITGVMAELRTEVRLNRPLLRQLSGRNQSGRTTGDPDGAQGPGFDRFLQEETDLAEQALTVCAFVSPGTFPEDCFNGWDWYLFFRTQEQYEACLMLVAEADEDPICREQAVWYTPDMIRAENEADWASTMQIKAILLLIVTIISGISVFGTMHNSVADRTKEIGIRKALGAGDMEIIMGFMIENFLNALLAILFAVALASIGFLAFSFYQRQILLTDYTVAFYPVTVGLFVCYALSNVIGFGLIPAYHATQINVVDALREE